MRQVTALEIIAITMERDKHYMYFTQVIDVFPDMKGPTVISETNRLLTGKEFVPAPIGPVTIRSFN